jgi:hypothetical protein
MFLLNYRWNYYTLLEPIKARHEGRSIHTPRSQTMGSKEPEPWSPRWVRQQRRERNNGLPANDLNHDEKPPTSAGRPLCKCDFECQSYMSIEYDTYSHWVWDEEKSWRYFQFQHLHCLFLMMSLLTVLFSWRVFMLSSSHYHQNHQDVIQIVDWWLHETPWQRVCGVG